MAEDVKRELIQVVANRSKEHASIAQKTFAVVVKVFKSFLPKDYEPKIAPMRPFWDVHVRHEILSRVPVSRRRLNKFINAFKSRPQNYT